MFTGLINHQKLLQGNVLGILYNFEQTKYIAKQNKQTFDFTFELIDYFKVWFEYSNADGTLWTQKHIGDIFDSEKYIISEQFLKNRF